MNTLKHCLVTNGYADVVKPFDIARDSGEITKKEFHTGIDLYNDSNTAYAVCHCVVTYVGSNKDEGKAVCIQYNQFISFRYCHLEKVFVSEGELITQGTEIGTYKQFVHFECLSSIEKSDWLVRIWGREYYKHDPLTYIDGSFEYDLRSQYPSGTLDDKYWDVDALLESGEIQLGGDMIVQSSRKERKVSSSSGKKPIRNRGFK